MSNITLLPRISVIALPSFWDNESSSRSSSSPETGAPSSISWATVLLATFLRASSKRSAVSSETDALSSVRPTLPDAVVASTLP